MFSTCLHCHRSLGKNERIEHFPIGARLAFDSAKGRLWAICSKCRRWNLSPIDERWEAIEECERLYTGTRLRASTDNIGLARLPDGTDIVRIGAPKTPEMAAWRYARDFRRRWLRNGLPTALLGGGGFTGMQVVLSGSTALLYSVLVPLAIGSILLSRTHSRARIALPNGRVKRVTSSTLTGVRLEPVESGWGFRYEDDKTHTVISGPTAVQGLRAMTTAANFGGAPPEHVDGALACLENAGRPDQFIARLARATQRTGIRELPSDVCLALEMALHEDAERRALEGELHALRDEWELAEEIAAISDSMLLPESVQRHFRSMVAEKSR